ncbi:MAG: hypothetical protein IKI37_11890 [Oscillospiraceae bacterium]|nr:hypothetical protein [Oscillospiraceae bacterium]
MKKFLSMVTALSCIGSMMAVLPAQAEEQTQTYIVIGLDAPQALETYLLSDTNGNTYILEAESVSEFSDGETFTVGDILDVITVNKAVLGKETIPDEMIPYVDFNQNGVPDSDDALTMLKKIVGLA